MELTVAARDVSYGQSSGGKDGLTVNGSEGRVGTGIVSLSDVAALGRLEVRGRTLVARELGRRGFAGGKLEDVAGIGGMAEMAVEPPFVKGEIDERSDRPVVVREGLAGDVESVHARVENRCGTSARDRALKEERDLQTWACT